MLENRPSNKRYWQHIFRTGIPAVGDCAGPNVGCVVPVTTYANDVPVSNGVVDTSAVVPAALDLVTAGSTTHALITHFKQEKF